MEKQKRFIKWVVVVFAILIIYSGYYFYAKNIKKAVPVPKEEIVTILPTEEKLLQQEAKIFDSPDFSTFNILNAIPKNLNVIKNDDGKIITVGKYNDMEYKLAINTVLRPDGKCIDEDYYYNVKTKTSSVGWYSISSNDHKSGNFKRYGCNPGAVIGEFSIPLISTEIHDFGDYDISDSVKLNVITIKNNLNNQVYVAQNPQYSLQELDIYGNALQKIFSNCLVPMYNGKQLLRLGPDKGECFLYFWQDSAEYKVPVLYGELYAVSPELRKNFVDLLTNTNCKKGYVADYLLNLSLHQDQFNQKKIIEDLSCAGKFTVEKALIAPE